MEAYHNQPNQVAVWALESYINTLNRLIEERSHANVENPYAFLTPIDSLVIAHTRIGQLCKKMGDVEKSKYHLQQAMLHIKNTNFIPFFISQI